MLLTSLSVTMLALAAGPAQPATAPMAATEWTAPTCATPALSSDHGKLDWFEGTWDELLAEAKAQDKIIFLDFWTDW